MNVCSFSFIYILITWCNTECFWIDGFLHVIKGSRKYAPGKLPPMKCFCEFFLISNFYFYENFLSQEKSIFIRFIFLLKITICLFYIFPLFFFLCIYFWFSGMAYNVYHTWTTILGIVTWPVKRITEKLPSLYGSAIIRPYKSNFYSYFKENCQ